MNPQLTPQGTPLTDRARETFNDQCDAPVASEEMAKIERELEEYKVAMFGARRQLFERNGELSTAQARASAAETALAERTTQFEAVGLYCDRLRDDILNHMNRAENAESTLAITQAELRAVSAALAFELAENLKLSGPKTTQFDLEMFVTKQAYRLQALSAVARPDAPLRADTPPSS